MQALYTAFPDLQHTVEGVIAEGDKVAMRASLRGTHRGEFQGVSPTGNPVAFGTVALFRFAEGKIAELWELADVPALLRQIGASGPMRANAS